MDDYVRRIRRAAEAGDAEAWLRIEDALGRQYEAIIGLPIWIVRYSHRHGTDINVFLTPEEAYRGISGLLDDYWEEEMNEARPENIEEALEAYNDRNAHQEYIDLEESRIRSMPPKTE